MKTTVEVPDELYRRAKAEAALSGRKLRDLVEEGLRLVLNASRKTRRDSNLAGLTKRARGMIDSGVPVCEPVLAEAMNFLRVTQRPRTPSWELTQSGALSVAFRNDEHIGPLRKLTQKYEDTAMCGWPTHASFAWRRSMIGMLSSRLIPIS